MNGFQAPKFAVGQVVYWPGYRQESRVRPCPDCLGAGYWQVETPAGEKFPMQCATCCPWIGRSDITEHYYVPRVEELTIGMIGWEQRESVGSYRYMARETGIGTGSVYEEARLFATEDAAREVAALLAQKADEEYQARVKRNSDETKRKARRKPDPQAREITRLTAKVRDLEKLLKALDVDADEAARRAVTT
jgi:hypothetical protein